MAAWATNSHRNEFTLTFGLSQHNRIDRIEVHWPNSDHTVTTLRDHSVNRFITIDESRLGVGGELGAAAVSEVEVGEIAPAQWALLAEQWHRAPR